MNEDTEAVILVLAILLFVIAIISGAYWMVHNAGVEGAEVCKKTCEAKGFEYLKWIGGHINCKCFDKGGDIIYLSTT